MISHTEEDAKVKYNEKNYGEALVIYEDIREADPITFDEKCNYHYQWCLYRLKLMPKSAFDKDKIESARKAFKYIIKNLTNQDLLYQLTIMRIVNYLEEESEERTDKINLYLDCLDPEYLSDEVREIKMEDGTSRSYPSQKEKWYATKVKCLYKLNLFEECIVQADKGMNAFERFHYGNDLWMMHKKALSLTKLESYTEAISVFEKLLMKRTEWFFYADMGKALELKGSTNRSISTYHKAYLEKGPDEMKINLLQDLCHIYRSIEDTDISNLYYRLRISLKNKKGWKLDHQEAKYFEEQKDFFDHNNYEALKKEAILIAKRDQWLGSQMYKGEVSVILPNGKSGFIKGRSQSFYFSTKEIVDQTTLQSGDSVSFYTKKGFDTKKNMETLVAINIEKVIKNAEEE